MDRITVEVTVDPPIPNAPLFIQAYDPDDPSHEFDEVDSELDAANDLKRGVDNRDKDRGFFVDPAKIFGVRDKNGPTQVALTSEAGGKVSYDFIVAHQPGDNHRVAATTLDTGNFVLSDEDVGASITQRPGFRGKLSPLLTIWRKLHVEVDSMQGESDTGRSSPDIQMVDLDFVDTNDPVIDDYPCYAEVVAGFMGITLTVTVNAQENAQQASDRYAAQLRVAGGGCSVV